MKDLDWQDLKLFLSVAHAGGLGPAARVTGTSAPTLGRRVAALEASLGMRLFIRGRQGYDLTDAGRTLLGHAQEFEAAAAGIDRWRADSAMRPSVRISAGHFMTSFLADRIEAVWTRTDSWSIEFVTAAARLDIGRRAADIGIRNRRPEEAWLAGRRIATVAFAAYCRHGASTAADSIPWIGVTGDAAITPSAQWLTEHHAEQISIRANDPRLVRDLVRRGAGQAVLPCLVGDHDPDLQRSSVVIEALSSEQWLVTHHEDRHNGAIHATADRIARLIKRNRDLFAGRQTKTGAVEAPAQPLG